jgi:predicted PurR-regulated permease PerM
MVMLFTNKMDKGYAAVVVLFLSCVMIVPVLYPLVKIFITHGIEGLRKIPTMGKQAYKDMKTKIITFKNMRVEAFKKLKQEAIDSYDNFIGGLLVNAVQSSSNAAIEIALNAMGKKVTTFEAMIANSIAIGDDTTELKEMLGKLQAKIAEFNEAAEDKLDESLKNVYTEDEQKTQGE